MDLVHHKAFMGLLLAKSMANVMYQLELDRVNDFTVFDFEILDTTYFGGYEPQSPQNCFTKLSNKYYHSNKSENAVIKKAKTLQIFRGHTSQKLSDSVWITEIDQRVFELWERKEQDAHQLVGQVKRCTTKIPIETVGSGILDRFLERP